MNQAATTLETADIVAILKALPHRYPFLMVDRIINMRGDESAIGIKNVTANEPQWTRPKLWRYRPSTICNNKGKVIRHAFMRANFRESGQPVR